MVNKKIKNVTDETSFDTTDYLLFKINNSEMFSLFIKELINNAKVSIYGRLKMRTGHFLGKIIAILPSIENVILIFINQFVLGFGI